jgi:hypothetical protein
LKEAAKLPGMPGWEVDMSRKTWFYNSSLIAGLLFVVTGVRLYFRNDITGVVIHFILAVILFLAALFTGGGEKDGHGERRIRQDGRKAH